MGAVGSAGPPMWSPDALCSPVEISEAEGEVAVLTVLAS